MTQTCACGTPSSSDRYLCNDCTAQLWRALGNVPAISNELDVSLTKQRRFAETTGHSNGEQLPYDLAASRALTRLRDTLTGIAARCIRTHVTTSDPTQRHHTPALTLPSLSAWLICRVDGIAAQPWAADALDIVRAVEHSTHVIDRPPGHSYAGPCDQCGHDLYARDGKPTVTCRDCALEYDLAARRGWLLQCVDDQLATAVEIARALTSLELPVTAERIRQWRHRDRIEIKAHDRQGRPLYRVGDIVDLLVEYAQHTA